MIQKCISKLNRSSKAGPVLNGIFYKGETNYKI